MSDRNRCFGASCAIIKVTNRFFIINYVTLVMAQDAPKRRFLSLIFLVSIIIIIIVISNNNNNNNNAMYSTMCCLGCKLKISILVNKLASHCNL